MAFQMKMFQQTDGTILKTNNLQNFKTKSMKILKALFFLMIIGSLTFISCESDPLPVYPGNIIQIDTVFVKGVNITYPTFTGSNTADDRFYAFSGGNSNDLSSLSGEDWDL